jgi:hypothetical protein
VCILIVALFGNETMEIVGNCTQMYMLNTIFDHRSQNKQQTQQQRNEKLTENNTPTHINSKQKGYYLCCLDRNIPSSTVGERGYENTKTSRR